MSIAIQRRIAGVVLVAGLCGLVAAGAALLWSPEAVSQGAGVSTARPEPSGSAAPSTTLGPPSVIGNELFVVGDSVMQGAAPFLADELPEWTIISDTRVGRFTDEGIRVVKRRQKQLGDVVVVGLGNNYNGDRAQFAEQVDEMLDELTGVKHILWVTVSEFRDDRTDVNAVLRAAARRDSRVELVDWTPLWRSDPNLTSSDRLHLTGDGAQEMAALIASTLNTLMLTTNQRPAPDPDPPQLNERGSIPGVDRSDTSARPRRGSTSTLPDSGVTTSDPDDSGPRQPSTTPSSPTEPSATNPALTAPVVTAPGSTVPLTSPPSDPPIDPPSAESSGL